MDNETFDKALAKSIRTTREKAGMSLNALAVHAAIPYATLYRKLEMGSGSLLAKDVHSIAKALNVSDADLWPEVNA
jgi:lambda repressor-like predicted transcriptional regulator